MKYTDLTKEKWNTFHYNNGMTDLENFLVRMIVKFYHTHPSHAEDAFSGLYNYICSEWLTASVEHEQEQEQEQDCNNNGGNCDNYLLESHSDEYYD